MFGVLRKLLGLGGAAEATPGFNTQLFIYIRIPGDIQPIARGERFEDPLQAVLEETGLGEISGGGSQLAEPYPDGRPRVEFCGIDADATDLDKARALLMRKLIELDAPTGTELHYTKGESMLLDRLVDGAWSEAELRSIRHPGFGA